MANLVEGPCFRNTKLFPYPTLCKLSIKPYLIFDVIPNVISCGPVFSCTICMCYIIQISTRVCSPCSHCDIRLHTCNCILIKYACSEFRLDSEITKFGTAQAPIFSVSGIFSKFASHLTTGKVYRIFMCSIYFETYVLWLLSKRGCVSVTCGVSMTCKF
jgi:hypothetical protein